MKKNVTHLSSRTDVSDSALEENSPLVESLKKS